MIIGYGVFNLFGWCVIGCELCDNWYIYVIVLFNLVKLVLIFWFVNILKCTGWKGEFCYGLFNDLCLDKCVF